MGESFAAVVAPDDCLPIVAVVAPDGLPIHEEEEAAAAAPMVAGYTVSKQSEAAAEVAEAKEVVEASDAAEVAAVAVAAEAAAEAAAAMEAKGVPILRTSSPEERDADEASIERLIGRPWQILPATS